MTTDTTATYGATRASWQNANPRKVLRALIEGGLHGNRLVEAFWDEIKDDEAMLRVCLEYYVANNERSLNSSRTDKEAIAKQVATTKSAMKAKVVKNFLDTLMPNGKPLGKCTGKECLEMGGGLTAIGNMVPSNEIVENVIDGTQAQKLLGI